ncbi:hypothetical protein [Neisseria canis]|nr:hypothetical protein [Neisseria canis]
MLYLYAFFPPKLDGDVWTQAASAPVPLAKLFPESETLCIQSPYGFPEEMEAALGTKVERLTMLDNEGLAIWWLFDKDKKVQKKLTVLERKGVYDGTGLRDCHAVSTQCLIISEKKPEYSRYRFEACRQNN